MKKIVFLCLVAMTFLVCMCADREQEKQPVTETQPAKKPTRVLRHVVLSKFKDTTTPEQIKQIEEGFAALPEKIDLIHDYEWGTDVSVQGLSEGYTHCFLVTFLSEADRDAYLPHPVHQDFSAIMGPQIDKILVVNYWTVE